MRSPLVPASPEPRLSLQHTFALPAGPAAAATDLLRIDERLYVNCMRVDRDGVRTLVGTHALEWRRSLSSGGSHVLAELAGVGMEASVPAGLVELELQLIPQPRSLIGEYELGSVLGDGAAQRAERERKFIVYARQWWRDFLAIRDDHKLRLIKVREKNMEFSVSCVFVFCVCCL